MSLDRAGVSRLPTGRHARGSIPPHGCCSSLAPRTRRPRICSRLRLSCRDHVIFCIDTAHDYGLLSQSHAHHLDRCALSITSCSRLDVSSTVSLSTRLKRHKIDRNCKTSPRFLVSILDTSSPSVLVDCQILQLSRQERKKTGALRSKGRRRECHTNVQPTFRPREGARERKADRRSGHRQQWASAHGPAKTRRRSLFQLDHPRAASDDDHVKELRLLIFRGPSLDLRHHFLARHDRLQHSLDSMQSMPAILTPTKRAEPATRTGLSSSFTRARRATRGRTANNVLLH